MSVEHGTASSMSVQDERIMAALAHGSVLLPFVGVIAPIVIWATQREKSEYVAFQALQALAYQLTMVLAYFMGMACYICSFFGVFTFPLFVTSGEEVIGPAAGLMIGSMLIPFAVFGLILLGGVLFVLYGIIAAVQALQGKPFRYVIIGTRLERYLTLEGALPDQS